MNELDYTSLTPTPTATRPLLGLTILVVEDSRFACDAMRLLCLRSGARIRRADCLRSARRHLPVYRPSVVIIDLGLLNGSGAELISELSIAEPRISAILATSGDDMNEAVSMEAGADGFLSKPLASLAGFQSAVLKALPETMRPAGLREITDEHVDPDPLAFQDDMAHASEIFSTDTDVRTLDYIAQFIQGVAKSAHDDQLTRAARLFVRARSEGTTIHSHQSRLAGLIRDRMTVSVAI
ncbi:response regulator [Planktotalea sp.]|uniref:response regulator n=1 Tax=Planktotalea sp. TaxID=2029877 RepID=UPI0025CE2FE5|nr:response regulator [Planktotalea sp.]